MRFSFFVVAIILISAQVQATDARVHEIRVGLLSKTVGCKSVVVTSKSGLKIVAQDARQRLSVAKDSKYLFQTGSGNVVGGKQDTVGKPLGKRVVVQAECNTEPVLIRFQDGKFRQYSGALEISNVKDQIWVVNVLDMETYLKGVISNEMQAQSPLAALQAQAICARSWAYRNINKHCLDGFDVCDGTHCQVYGGAGTQKPSTDAAVAQTTGIVVTYRNELASVMYSSDSGGVTQDYSELRSTGSHPYLSCVMDPPEIPRTTWVQRYQLGDLAAKLAGAGVRGARNMTSIAVGRLGAGGRVLSVFIVDKAGRTELTAEKLRSMLGVNVIKSTLFALDCSESGQVLFVGRGYGHGIGMCQTGARALAAQPFNYSCEQILTHYFPGTQLGVVDKTVSTTARVSKPSDAVSIP